MLVPSFVVIVLMVWNLLSKETRVDAQMRWWQSIQTLFHLAHHEQFVSAATGIFTATSVEGYAQEGTVHHRPSYRPSHLASSCSLVKALLKDIAPNLR